jgi:serine/threonine protein kinase
MEYAGEELEDYMSKDGPFNEVDGKHIFGQIVSAVDYMVRQCILI